MAVLAAGPFAPGIFFEAPPNLTSAADPDRSSPHVAALRAARQAGRAVKMLALVALLGGAQAHAQVPSAAVAVPGLRLPRDIVPLHYEPQLRVDPASDVFSGTIDITVRVLEPTDLVWLNARKLTIRVANAIVAASGSEPIAATVVPGSDDVIGLRFASALPAGETRLTIGYSGVIDRDRGIGLFRQREGENWYALTQFEPLDARRVFPSFDEPDRKAPWTLTLVVPATMRAFSNMPVASEREVARGWREFTFQRTPPLPSYLVAFAVGDFDVRDAGRAGRNGTPVSIVTPKGRASEAAYAAANTGAILAATEQYFGIPYPFPKLDLLAYPKSTFGGAMENPGLITFTSRILLARPDEMSPVFEQRFIGVAAHEIAHLWFGDYVTMAWWDDLWLNESFASWMGSLVTAQLRPDWPRGGWRSRQRSTGMEFDRLQSARRIRQPVTAHGEVRAAFDGITYAKGETVLAMFEQWLGPEKFREGVRRYLGKHAWGNATAEDFFAALAATDDALVPALRGFVERAGVPLLDVALDCAGAPALQLTQQRFQPVGAPSSAAESWVFPACFDFGDARSVRQACVLVRSEKQTVPLPVAACPQWVIANRSGLGYYLPRLTPALYAALPKSERLLSGADYEPLLADAELLARAGSVGYQDVLPIAARLGGSNDPRAARRAYEFAGSVPRALVEPHNVDRYAAWIRSHFGDRARGLGWVARRDESPDLLRLRETAVPLVSDRGQDKALARKAQQLAQRWLVHRTAVPPNSRRMVLMGAARAGGKDAPRLFDGLIVVAKTGRDQNERDDAFAALGAFRDPALQARALALMLDTQVNPRDTVVMLAEALRDDVTRPAALLWLVGNGKALMARAPGEQQAYWPVMASGACTDAERTLFVSAFGARISQVDGGPRKYRESLEAIDQCLASRQSQRAPLNAFLAGAR